MLVSSYYVLGQCGANHTSGWYESITYRHNSCLSVSAMSFISLIYRIAGVFEGEIFFTLFTNKLPSVKIFALEILFYWRYIYQSGVV